MKTLRRILIIFLCIVLVVLATGYLLPGKVHVERSLLISSPAESLFEQVNTLKNWVNWSPWLQKDTAILLNYSGPAKGVGAALSWKSKKSEVGNGNAMLISSIPYDSLIFILDYGENGKTLSTFRFKKSVEGTTVTWCLDSDVGINPVSRWLGLFVDRIVGHDLESGLLNLEGFVKNNKMVNGFEIFDIEVPARVLLSVRDTASNASVEMKLAAMFEMISRFVKKEDLSPTSSPLTIYHKYTFDSYDIETCIPVSSAIQTPKGINCIETEPQKAIMVKYFGTRSLISKAYGAIQIYLNNNGINVSGPAWEEYTTDPNHLADSNARQTNIYVPVAKK